MTSLRFVLRKQAVAYLYKATAAPPTFTSKATTDHPEKDPHRCTLIKILTTT